MRLAADGFAPHYLWGVEIVAGETIQAGEVPLQPGASLAGWVIRSERTAEPRPIRLRLEPEVIGAESTRIGERLSHRALEATANERGFFQFSGLAEGSYRLEARAETRFAPARVEEIRIDGPTEHRLEDTLLLWPRSMLEISIVPFTGADGEPWRVRLEEELTLSSMTREVTSVTASLSGLAALEGLGARRYYLSIEDAHGTRYYREALDLTAGSTARHLELETVPVRGSIVRGDEGVALRLLFMSADGSERSILESDEEGRFTGYLPSEGEWRVKLLPRRGRGQRFLDETVEVSRGPDGIAELRIELPDTCLAGTVEDEGGTPVTPALVTAFRNRRVVEQAWVDETGAFELLGIEPGPLQIKAEAEGDRESQMLTEEVREKGEAEPIQLTVRGKATLHLRIESGSLPVPGARVRLTSADELFQLEVVADPRGETEVSVPRSIRNLDFAIVAPGLPVKIGRLTISGGSTGPVTLPIVRPGGTLGIRPSRRPLFISHDGGRVPFRSLLLPSGHGPPRGFDPQTGAFEIAVEAGEYQLCEGLDVSAACIAGYVSPGGWVALDAPSHERSEERTARGQGGTEL